MKKTHGMHGKPIYAAWNNMIARCYRPSHRQFADYGGRGITVCEPWRKFENFYADMGEKPSGYTLERDDVNGNYEPSNCRWATMAEQQCNRRNNLWIEFNGERKTVAQWSRATGVREDTIRQRLLRGLHPSSIFQRPNLDGVPWNKGMKMSPESRAKMSAAAIGRKGNRLGAKHSEETLAKLRGRTFSTAHLANLSNAHRGQIPWNKGRTHPLETRAKISAALRARSARAP